MTTNIAKDGGLTTVSDLFAFGNSKKPHVRYTDVSGFEVCDSTCWCKCDEREDVDYEWE